MEVWWWLCLHHSDFYHRILAFGLCEVLVGVAEGLALTVTTKRTGLAAGLSVYSRSDGTKRTPNQLSLWSWRNGLRQDARD